MPKLWSETIETHRKEVRKAVIETTATLVAKHGLRGVTMSQIAEDTGIGRATLYKYFPDVEAILVAWHEQHVTGHLDHLVSLRDQSEDAAARLGAVLEAYALICYEIAHQGHGADLTALVHRGEHIASAQQHLRRLLGDLIAEGARDGLMRSDVAPHELAAYCLNALAAASGMASKAAVRRLVAVSLAGLRP
ncbi:MAG: TetR/AcrR family transcriptional regulator [Mycobacteriales bacterium]